MPHACGFQGAGFGHFSKYTFSGSKVIAEYDNGAAPTSPSREYIYSGGALLAKIASGTSTYYHLDQLSNRLVTDSNGNSLKQLGTYPFGESWYNTSGEKWLFATYGRDAESQNDYALARSYVNRLARFSSLDPLNGSPANPQSFNRYAYTLNDPVNLADPSGLDPCDNSTAAWCVSVSATPIDGGPVGTSNLGSLNLFGGGAWELREQRFGDCRELLRVSFLERIREHMKSFLRIGATLVTVLAAIAAADSSAGIRRVDFRNFSYPWSTRLDYGYLTWHWLQSSPKSKVRLVNGLRRFIDPDAPELVREHSPSLRFDSVTYGILGSHRREVAVVALNYSTGGTQNWDYVYVYVLDQGKPRLRGRVECGSRAYGGLMRTSVNDGLLTLDLADPEKRTGDCCSTGYISVRYRWTRDQFVEEGPREHGDLKPADLKP